ncbi:peptidase inhibitor family I36 protein [Streptomyces sp. NPDC052396]|uniref:peptidase inhibitor family I36 protein n=1 Tax=Streptomyces sp. NPDC052396 TaxID=3365689 RepID=UPI0037D4279E
MSVTRARLFSVLAALALSTTLLGAQQSTAAPAHPAGPSVQALQRAAEQCGRNEICFWENNDFDGTPWRWTPTSGYRDMPPYLHDNVGSFYANAAGCFIDWDPHEMRKVASGDYSNAYKAGGKFGSRIDAVTVYQNC